MIVSVLCLFAPDRRSNNQESGAYAQLTQTFPDIPFTPYLGGEEAIDAAIDLWIRELRKQYPGVRVLTRLNKNDWKELGG